MHRSPPVDPGRRASPENRGGVVPRLGRFARARSRSGRPPLSSVNRVGPKPNGEGESRGAEPLCLAGVRSGGAQRPSRRRRRRRISFPRASLGPPQSVQSESRALQRRRGSCRAACRMPRKCGRSSHRRQDAGLVLDRRRGRSAVGVVAAPAGGGRVHGGAPPPRRQRPGCSRADQAEQPAYARQPGPHASVDRGSGARTVSRSPRRRLPAPRAVSACDSGLARRGAFTWSDSSLRCASVTVSYDTKPFSMLPVSGQERVQGRRTPSGSDATNAAPWAFLAFADLLGRCRTATSGPLHVRGEVGRQIGVADHQSSSPVILFLGHLVEQTGSRRC